MARAFETQKPVEGKGRIAVASCYDKTNYGSALQAYATQAAIERLGYEVETIDKSGLKRDIGRGRRDYYKRHLFDAGLYQSKAGFGLHHIRQKTNPSFGRSISQRERMFDSFRKSHFNMSKRCNSFWELSWFCKRYDAVVAGSDQLWLPVNISGNFFTLSFVKPPTHQIAYSTSFGVSQLDCFYLDATRQFLSKFDAISVREKTGADIIRRASGLDVPVVCDPVMLLESADWERVANQDYPVPDKPYLFCYLLGTNAWNRECVRQLAKERGLAIVAFSHLDEYVPDDDSGWIDYQFYDAGPAEFLRVLSQAQCVCTDSFHASAFAMIFNRELFAFRRHENVGNHSTNSRLDTLLESTGAPHRLCESPEWFQALAAAGPDDPQVAMLSIESMTRESLGFLERSLAAACNHSDNDAPRHGCIKIKKAEDCCGCTACVNACPLNCISMVFDKYGCEYPHVQDDKCIRCGKCVAACPVMQPTAEKECHQTAYIVQHRDPDVLLQSTSGGAFTALAQDVISHNGIVYGAAYERSGRTDKLRVAHRGVERESELAVFRNSKYTQSAIEPYLFREIKRWLEEGREVLFSGTPCQVEGLSSFLQGGYEHLIMVDVVCHAIPCRIVFEAYQDWLSVTSDRVPDLICFRDKRKHGYRYSKMQAYNRESNEPFYSAGVESDPYLRAFFSDLCDRAICYECPFKKRYRSSDITLWDCFDPGRFAPELDDNRGATFVLAQSAKGAAKVERSSNFLRICKVDPDAAVATSKEMVSSVERNIDRDRFLDDLTIKGAEVLSSWLPDNMRVKLERLARTVLVATPAYDTVKKGAKKVLGG